MALAYATDLATGHSRDFALRSCVLGMRFADLAGLDKDTRRRIYHQALLRYIGCNADTHLLAAHWGDEITLRRELHHIDMGNRAEFVELLVRALKRKFAGAPPEELEEAVKLGLAEGPQVNIPILSGHCEVAQRIAERIGLPEDIRESLGQIYERWDGKGMPRGLSGNAVKFPVRVVTMAQDAIALNDHHGFAKMKEMIAKRAGGGYEPELVDIFLTNAGRAARGSRRARRPSDNPGAGARAAFHARRRGMRGSLSGDRRHDRHAHAVHVRPFARRSVACRMRRQSRWAFPRPTFAMSGGRRIRTTSAS